MLTVIGMQIAGQTLPSGHGLQIVVVMGEGGRYVETPAREDGEKPGACVTTAPVADAAAVLVTRTCGIARTPSINATAATAATVVQDAISFIVSSDQLFNVSVSASSREPGLR